MNKEEIMTKIREYFTRNFGDKVDMVNMPLNGGLMAYLGVDSLRSLEILIDMETMFDVEITDDILSFKLVDNVEHMTETFMELQCKV